MKRGAMSYFRTSPNSKAANGERAPLNAEQSPQNPGQAEAKTGGKSRIKPPAVKPRSKPPQGEGQADSGYSALEIDHEPLGGDESDPESGTFEYATGGAKYDWVWPTVLCPCGRRVGNMNVLCEVDTDQPDRRWILCVVGPYWPMMVFVTFPTIIITSIIVGITTLPKLNWLIRAVYLVLCVWVVAALCRVSCGDPGIFRRTRRKPKAEDEASAWIYSTQGGTWRPKDAKYSRDCNVVVEGFDHTCPWTGTAIGAKNLCAFECFTKSLLVLAVFDVVLAVLCAIKGA